MVALGKCGSREMTAGSDLDLMTLYRAGEPDAASAVKGWAAETFYGRFTQRLIAALSAPTAEGELYEVDMQLAPLRHQGPVAVSFARLRELLRRRGGDLGVPGPDPRPGGLGQRRRLRAEAAAAHRGGAAPRRAIRRAPPPTCATCAS